MNLKTTFENQKMASCSLCCLFRSPLPWKIALLVCSLLIIISGFLGFGYNLSILILTSLVLIISTVFFTFSKQKPLLLPVEKVEEAEETPKSEPYSTTLLQMDQEVVLPKKVHLENETIVQKMEAQRGSMNKIIDDYSVRSPDELSDSTLPENENPAQKKEVQEGGMHQIHDNCLVSSRLSSDSLSESESVEDSSTSEDSETDWLFQDNVMMNQSSVCSDGSISDEESLIEIALPTGHYVSSSSSSSNEKDPKLKKLQKFQKKKMPDFMAKSIFQQHSNSLMELLAEINEENLIEIDISMGSIKCSRFEIEA